MLNADGSFNSAADPLQWLSPGFGTLTVFLNDSSTAAATVPQSITIAPESTGTVFNITPVASGSTTISVSPQGMQAAGFGSSYSASTVSVTVDNP